MLLIFYRYIGLYDIRSVDSAKQNLASSFVNAFLNCGFGGDKIMAEDSNKWIHKNKEHGISLRFMLLILILVCNFYTLLLAINRVIYLTFYDIISTGMLSATASMGLIQLWDIDAGLTQIDKFLYSSEDYIKVNH